MTSIYFDSLPNELFSPSDEHELFSPSDEQQHEHQCLRQASSSLNSVTCHLYLKPISTHHQDGGAFNEESHPSLNEDDSLGSEADNNFCLWKRGSYVNDEKHELKWKMRVMLKKESDVKEAAASMSMSPPTEYHAFSNSISCSNNNIRVCSDCTTTKTPLWRTGPQGPKSLCNACGIRQRKARKAAAAAAAEITVLKGKPTSLKATKQILHKPNNAKYKKKPPATKNCVEEFLIRLSKNLAFHRVFPQDEKDAAILLMALSCGYVHQ